MQLLRVSASLDNSKALGLDILLASSSKTFEGMREAPGHCYHRCVLAQIFRVADHIGALSSSVNDHIVLIIMIHDILHASENLAYLQGSLPGYQELLAPCSNSRALNVF